VTARWPVMKNRRERRMFSLPTADKNIGMTPNARIDALTSLPNLHSLFLQLDAELARSKRTDTALALVVVALEGFTQFTERFGRPEGGRLLKLVAIGLQQNFREYDCVARMAGAEFVLVLSGLKPQDLPEKLKRVEAVTRGAVAAVSGESSSCSVWARLSTPMMARMPKVCWLKPDAGCTRHNNYERRP